MENHSLILASTSEIRRKLASKFDSSIKFYSPTADEDALKKCDTTFELKDNKIEIKDKIQE